MLNQNAKAWVAELKSGKWKQGKRRLALNGRFCCLGVACELAYKAGITERRISSGLISYDGSDTLLPQRVQEWLGLRTADGYYSFESLMEDNDNGVTFEEIADIIESEPRGLFRAVTPS